jgi:hypothetical protein
VITVVAVMRHVRLQFASIVNRLWCAAFYPQRQGNAAVLGPFGARSSADRFILESEMIRGGEPLSRRRGCVSD